MSRLLQDYLRASAEVRPEATALVMGEERMTYGELESTSNRLARLLVGTGVRRGDRVCLFVPKSPAAIVGMLSVLKADAVYVPIDISSPAPRVRRMMEAAQPRLLLATRPATGLIDEVLAGQAARPMVASLEVGSLCGASFRSAFSLADAAAHPDEAPPRVNTETDPAHLLFTSGSTGTPKGVVITHANVRHFVDWAACHFETQPSDRISGHPPLYFDLSTFDIYGTLSAGAQLHLVPPELNLLPNKLAAFIREHELTQWFSVPSTLTQMVKFGAVRDFPSLRRLLWCGEPMPTPTLMALMDKLPHVRFTNLYGPTEATIASSYYDVPKRPASELEPIPIGRACAGEELLVLDEELAPVPPGEVGHLYIGGVGLSPGYWQDEAKTGAAFLPDPRDPSGSARIYRTGDLGRQDEAGLFYCLGRLDSQIKSRGYRIELGEIEAAVSSLTGLRECAVVGVRVGGFEGTAICCAYAPSQGCAPEPASLRGQLAELLPRYMLPNHWMSYEVLPKNPNGKIDRKKLK
ncbi:MAG TPA: amino acid adenylation domain-containing protein, partial [Trueperaceae bacterium]